MLAQWRGRELGALLGSVPRSPRPVGMPPEFDVICVLHLAYGHGDTKRVRLVRATDGTVLAHELDAGDAVVEMDRLNVNQMLIGLDQFRGDYDGLDAPRQEVLRVDGLATPGWILFDNEVLDTRLRSPSIRFDPTMRYIEEEGFHVPPAPRLRPAYARRPGHLDQPHAQRPGAAGVQQGAGRARSDLHRRRQQ